MLKGLGSIERPVQGNSSSLTMWWHSLECSMSLLYRFCVPLWCTYCWKYLLWLFTFIDDDWWFMDDVLLTCGSWIEVDIFCWLYLMILVFDLYLVHVWFLVMWYWYWIECYFNFNYIFLLSIFFILEVVLVIRIPFLGMFYDLLAIFWSFIILPTQWEWKPD